MKIAYIVDKKIDQSEIESKYLWHLKEIYMKKRTWFRVNLSKKSIDFTNEIVGDSRYIEIFISLPNNQLYGMRSDGLRKELFISDECLNMKIIKANINNQSAEVTATAACFYGDSIFNFQNSFEFSEYSEDDLPLIKLRLEKYSIKNNSWTPLASPPDFPCFCIAINQKIMFFSKKHGDRLWIYDISINSYTYHSPIFDYWISIRWLTKHAGRLYLFAVSSLCKIYCCDDPLSDWNVISSFEKHLILVQGTSRFLGHYESSNYFLKGKWLYKFSLEDLKAKRVGQIFSKNK